MIGTSIALHLAKRGVKTALVDRRGPGEETSYGNAGVIEGNTLFPYPFPPRLSALVRIALKRATEADYHFSYLPRVATWILGYRAYSRPERMLETVELMRPLFTRALPEHELLIAEAGAGQYLLKQGWLKIYRSERVFAALKPELALAEKYGIPHQALDVEGARALEPTLAPVFRHAMFWPQAASLTNPLAVTQAYEARFGALGGVFAKGDARTLRRTDNGWRVETADGPLDGGDAVIALGPWAPDVLEPLGISLPLRIKRGYHMHYRPRGNMSLNRPVLDAEVGYCVVPMEQGLRLTTGAEFADRDARPTPVQLARLLPQASALFPLGEALEPEPWMGSRPCFYDSRPVIGRAPGQPGLWLAYGHAHWGLTLGPATGRLLAEMMTGTSPFCDPAPYGAERFS